MKLQQTTRKKVLNQVRNFQILITGTNKEKIINVSDVLENTLNEISHNSDVVNIKYFIEK